MNDQNLDMFNTCTEVVTSKRCKQKELNQYFTAPWFATLMVQKYLPELTSSDLVLEPSCGMGSLLKAIPSHVGAVGVELDREVALKAKSTSGRDVLVGDFTTIDIPFNPTAIIGNPPFKLDTFEQMLVRSYELLGHDQKAVYLLPAYFFQTAKSVVRFKHKWSIEVDFVPRDIYSGLSKPLVIAQFIKDGKRLLKNLFFYVEKIEYEDMSARSKEILKDQNHRSVWRALVEDAVKCLGGKAKLKQIYDFISQKRPTENPFWKEQVRKVAQMHLSRVGFGEYALD